MSKIKPEVCTISCGKSPRVRKYLTFEACKTLVQALVISRLDYSNALLYGINDGHFKHLQRLQDFAARLIFKAPRRENAEKFRFQLHWLPVEHRINFSIVTFVYKSLNNEAPVYLTELLSYAAPNRRLRSYSEYTLNQQCTINKAGDKAFKNCGPELWNKLSDEIRGCTSSVIFKKLLKTFYFRKAYNL